MYKRYTSKSVFRKLVSLIILKRAQVSLNEWWLRIRIVNVLFFKNPKLRLALFITMAFIVSFQGPIMPNANAVSPNGWVTGNIKVERSAELSGNPDAYGLYGSCTYQIVQLPNFWGNYQDTSACIFQAKTFRYTIVPEGILHIAMGDETIMYPVRNVGFYSLHYLVPSPSTDDVIFAHSVIKDLPNSVSLNVESAKPYYEPKENFLKNLSVDSNGISHDIYHSAVSRNGRWIVINFRDIGFIRFDLTDMSTTWVGSNRDGAEFMTVSNDGQHLAMSSFSSMSPPIVYDINGCGQNAETLNADWFTMDSQLECTYRELGPEINETLGSAWFTSNAKPEFNDDGTELTLFVSPNNTGGEGVVLTLQNQESIPQLDYLALGDSYSSGEGDTGKTSNGSPYYTSLTASLKGCHVSTRSYPFLLAQFTSLSSDRMQSVACSGAKVAQDYYGSGDSYFGQRNQLKNKTSVELTTERANALSGFNPGLLKQVDFVRVNKPKVVTLNGGGNDIGFGKIISYCALPSGVGARSNTCDQAVANTKQRSMLGDSIRSQYEKIIALINAIKEASESTTIYIIGYPSFVSESKSTCANSAALNQTERATINKSVNYLNKVLHEASKAAGAKYIDIEASLSGGRICEGSEYVTGPMNVLGFDVLDRKSEMFHPNSDGHIKMAEVIKNRGFAIDSNANPAIVATQAPTKPSTFGNSTYVPTFQDKLVADGVIQAGKTIQLTLSPGLYAINKIVSFTLWSNPEKLGSYKVGLNGTLSVSAKIPKSVEPGYHMIVAEGESSNGGPLKLYEFIEVQSSAINDRDGDGIKDDKDACQYMQHWYDELTNKDICAVKMNTQPAPGHGNGGNNGGGHSGAQHYHPVKTFVHYWKIVAHHHVLFGVAICISIFWIRIR